MTEEALLATTSPQPAVPTGFVLDAAMFRRVLETVGLWGFPRVVGTPGQTIVWSPDEFVRWWGANVSKTVPMFAGHNPFVPVPRTEKLIDRTALVFHSAFGDYDTGDGLDLHVREVLDNVQASERFFLNRNIDHAWLASGSMKEDDGRLYPAGFHAVVFFHEERRDRRYLERWENGFWRGLKNELHVRSVNIKCANPVALRRIPFSRYVHRKDPSHKGEYKAEPNYCVPVPYEWVANGRWDRIVDLSFHPALLPGIRYSSGLPSPSLESFVQSSQWGTFAHAPMELHPGLAEPPKGPASDLVRAYVPRRMCLQTLIFGQNPRHTVRVAFAHEILAAGLTSGAPFGLEEFVQLLFAVGREAKWEDFDEVETRRQATYAWNRPYALRKNLDGSPAPPVQYPFSCQKLREDGICLGPAKCGIFPLAFPRDWNEFATNHPEFA